MLTDASKKKAAARAWARGAAFLLAAFVASPALPQSQKVRVSQLSDVSFGQISNLDTEQRLTQSVCVAANTNADTYTVTAAGTGGPFVLRSGSSQLAYRVEWNPVAGRSTGSNLSAGVPLPAQYSPEKQADCKSFGLTASLIVVLPATSLSAASAGNYSGTLLITVAAE